MKILILGVAMALKGTIMMFDLLWNWYNTQKSYGQGVTDRGGVTRALGNESTKGGTENGHGVKNEDM